MCKNIEKHSNFKVKIHKKKFYWKKVWSKTNHFKKYWGKSDGLKYVDPPASLSETHLCFQQSWNVKIVSQWS